MQARSAAKAGVCIVAIDMPGFGPVVVATLQGPNGAWFQAVQATMPEQWPDRRARCGAGRRSGLDGGDRALLDWIDRSGLAAICADDPMVEKIEGIERCAGKAMLPLHEHCLVKPGIGLGEFWGSEGIAPWAAEHRRASCSPRPRSTCRARSAPRRRSDAS